MGCWVCQKCDEMVGLSKEYIDAHICKDEDIINRIKSLENTVNKLSRREDILIDGIRLFFSEIAPDIEENNGEGIFKDGVVMVDRSKLDTLYSLVKTERCPTSRDFSRLWDALYSSWLEASELFAEKPSRTYTVGNYKEKLDILRTEIERVRKLFGFIEEREFKSAESVVIDILNELT